MKTAFCLLVLLAFASHSFASKRSSPEDDDDLGLDCLSEYFLVVEEKEVFGTDSALNAVEQEEQRRVQREKEALKAFRSIDQTYDIELCRGPVDADSTMFMVSSGGFLQWDACQMIKVRDYNQIRAIANQIIALKRVGGHPNCGRLLDWGLHGDNNIYIITSNQYRGTLASLIETMNYDPGRLAAVVLKDMTEALRFIHTNNIDHLSVTLENIYLDHAGNFVLAGFTHADINDRKNEGQVYIEPTRYSAPELILYVLNKYAPRSYLYFADTWSLGVVIYRIITGRFPYDETVPGDGESSASCNRRMYDKIASEQINFDPIRQSMGGQWADLVAKMLSVDLYERPHADRILNRDIFSQGFDFDSVRKLILQTDIIAAPGNLSPAACSQAIKAHKDHQVDPVVMSRIYQGCLYMAQRADKQLPDEFINFPTFPSDSTAFFDNPSFSLVRLVSVIGHKDVRNGSIDEDPYGGYSKLSFFGVRFNSRDGMVQVECLDRIRSLKSKGNEILAMSKLGLLRRKPESFFGNVLILRRDLFAWPLKDVLKKENLPVHLKESLIVDLIREIAHVNRTGIIMTYLHPDSLAVRLDGSVGVLSYRGANLENHEMSFSWPCETTHYCAPERIENTLNRSNQPQTVNASVDAWSAGVIAYEIACGEQFADIYFNDVPPIEDCELRYVRNTVLATASNDSTWARLHGTVSPVLVQIIRSLLDPNPNTRMRVCDVNLDISLRQHQPGANKHIKTALTRSRHAEIAKLMGTEPEPNFINLSRQVAFHLSPRTAKHDFIGDDDFEQNRGIDFERLNEYFQANSKHWRQ